MAEQDLLTVAIPTHNGARHLAETLQSILAREGPRFPLVIRDDQSTDSTPEIVRAVAGDAARFERNPARLGLAGNWNRCVALCETPFVAIIHQDDVLRPGHLASHLAAFLNGPSTLGLVASGSEVIDDDGQPIPDTIVGRGGLGPVDRLFSPTEAIAMLAQCNPLRCSAVSIRKAAHEAVGGFDSSYRYVVDWDFWIRVAGSWSVSWLARPTVDVRWHPRSETHSFSAGTLDLEETERLLNALKDKSPEATPTREATRKLARAYLNRAYTALKAGNGLLARRCLWSGVQRDPALLRVILADPKLAAQLIATAALPGLAARVFRQGQ